MSQLSTAPEICCPKCKHEWNVGNDFELHVGSEVQCQGCGEILCLVDQEVTRNWRWDLVKAEKKG